MGNDEEAIKAANEAKEIAEEINHPLSKTNAYYRLGMAYFYQRKLDETKQMFEDALEVAESNGINRNTIYSHLALAKFYWYQKDYKASETNAKAGLSLAKEIGEKNRIVR